MNVILEGEHLQHRVDKRHYGSQTQEPHICLTEHLLHLIQVVLDAPFCIHFVGHFERGQHAQFDEGEGFDVEGYVSLGSCVVELKTDIFIRPKIHNRYQRFIITQLIVKFQDLFKLCRKLAFGVKSEVRRQVDIKLCLQIRLINLISKLIEYRHLLLYRLFI